MSYLDVFVLMLMLVITLVSITEIQTEQSQSAKTSLQETQKTSNLEAQTIDTVKAEQTLPAELTIPVVAPPLPKLSIPEILSTPHEPAPLETQAPEKPVTPTESPQVAEKIPEQSDIEAKQTEQQNKDWQEKFKQQLETLGIADAINLQFKNSSIHIEIQDNILFDSADALITAKGEQVLLPLTQLLQQSVGIIYIEGHTDNRPIATRQFPSNWELGAARALSVLHFLSQENIPESRLRATTYADTQPISNNEDPAGWQKNRRVNLIIKIPDMPFPPD